MYQMPFSVKAFQESINRSVEAAANRELTRACMTYSELTSSHQKAQCIHSMMNILDREVDEKTRWEIMEACGRRCIGNSTLDKALCLQKKSKNLDDLLKQLNMAHIGGGHLQKEGEIIHATYDRCYCGSVSKTKVPFSSTYCHCSCGWYRQLFETLLEKPVTVELLGSIIQGDDRCRFLIRINE